MMTGNAKLAGVIGWPVSHSLSPALHGYWIQELGLDAAYVPLAVQPSDFDEVVRALPRMGFRGVNVTLPHKRRAFEIADERDGAAQATEAANTLVFENGKIRAMNTDVPGFLSALDEAGAGSVNGLTATVLGAGGAGRAIVFALLSRGVACVQLINRSPDRAQELVSRFGSRVILIEQQLQDRALAQTDLLVNATSLGMAGQPPLVLDIGQLKSTAIVSDIVYRPLRTGLLSAAAARGHRTVDGLAMLLHQAREGFIAWYGAVPSVKAGLRGFLVSRLEVH